MKALITILISFTLGSSLFGQYADRLNIDEQASQGHHFKLIGISIFEFQVPFVNPIASGSNAQFDNLSSARIKNNIFTTVLSNITIGKGALLYNTGKFYGLYGDIKYTSIGLKMEDLGITTSYMRRQSISANVSLMLTTRKSDKASGLALLLGGEYDYVIGSHMFDEEHNKLETNMPLFANHTISPVLGLYWHFVPGGKKSYNAERNIYDDATQKSHFLFGFSVKNFVNDFFYNTSDQSILSFIQFSLKGRGAFSRTYMK